MSWAAVAIIGGSIIGGAISSGGARDAANTQAGAADRASETQKYMYDQTRKDQEPWRKAGEGALGGLQNPDFQKNFTMGDFQADPGYQFRMSEGTKALQNSAAARGSLNSGATMKALTRYSQGVASDEYQNAYNRFNNDASTRYNRLSSLAGLGQTANNQVGNAGQNYANQVSQNQIGVGNANAAAQIAQGNAINGAIGTGMNSWMQYNMMNRLAPQVTPAVGTFGNVGGSGSGMLGVNTNLGY